MAKHLTLAATIGFVACCGAIVGWFVTKGFAFLFSAIFAAYPMLEWFFILFFALMALYVAMLDFKN